MAKAVSRRVWRIWGGAMASDGKEYEDREGRQIINNITLKKKKK